MLDDLPPFLTLSQVAKLLQLGRTKVYELTVEWECTGGASGVPFVWFGHQKRVPKDAIIAIIQATMKRPPAA